MSRMSSELKTPCLVTRGSRFPVESVSDCELWLLIRVQGCGPRWAGLWKPEVWCESGHCPRTASELAKRVWGCRGVFPAP